MKELSIEEKVKRAIEGKAKAYDEALERARKELQICGSSDCDAARQIFRFFPELKENEDEKIRKTLIDFFSKGAKYGAQTNGIYDKDIIAWLEKRGESNPYSGVSFKYNGHTWGMCARDNGVEILVDGKIKERVFSDKNI